MKKIDKTIAHIRELERRLGEVDNNLRYIKVVQALTKSMESSREIKEQNQQDFNAFPMGFAFSPVFSFGLCSISSAVKPRASSVSVRSFVMQYS